MSQIIKLRLVWKDIYIFIIENKSVKDRSSVYSVGCIFQKQSLSTGFNWEKMSGVYQLNVLELELNCFFFINKTTK